MLSSSDGGCARCRRAGVYSCRRCHTLLCERHRICPECDGELAGLISRKGMWLGVAALVALLLIPGCSSVPHGKPLVTGSVSVEQPLEQSKTHIAAKVEFKL